MRLTRKRKYSKNKRKKINLIIASTALTLSFIGISQVTENTYAFFSDSKTINASFKAAFVFPSRLQQINRSLPTIIGKDCDENQLQSYEVIANKLDQEITSYYNRASNELKSNNNADTKRVYDYVSIAYHEFKMKKQQLLDQITAIRVELAQKESKDKEEKEKEINKAEEKDNNEQDQITQQNDNPLNESSQQNNDSSTH